MDKYDIDSLFQSVNDIYAQFDEGKITKQEANNILVRCCFAFLHDNAEEKTNA